MKRGLDREMETLKILILRMGAAVQRSLSQCLEAYLERDASLAEAVIRADDEINTIELEIDRDSLLALALGNPVAGDLRFILVVRRMNIDLERIGDQACNVARRAIYLGHRPPLPPFPPFLTLADCTERMFRTAMEAFAKKDTELARRVCEMDDEADRANVDLLKGVLRYMLEESPAIERGVQTIISARSLERICDLCTNIAENVIFMVEGINVKHPRILDKPSLRM